MAAKHEETSSVKPTMARRGGGLGPTKDAHKQRGPRSAEETLDEALEESFPASDPPAGSQPIVHVGAKTNDEKKQD